MKPVIRPAREADMTYVLASWCRRAYELTRDRPTLYTLFRPLFEGKQQSILKAASVLVAVNPEDDEQLFGFVVFEPSETPVLHFVTVKREFQKAGLARELMEAAGLRRDKTAIFSLWFSGTPRAWTYVPYGLMP